MVIFKFTTSLIIIIQVLTAKSSYFFKKVSKNFLIHKTCHLFTSIRIIAETIIFL